MSGSGYDLDVITLSPEGKVYQVEYAQKAVEKSSTIIGIHCKDGVILGSEKMIISKLQKPMTDRRIYSISETGGMAINGLIPDGRLLLKYAREETKGYLNNFGIPIDGKVLAERIGHWAHVFTLYWYLRPIGSTVIMANYDQYNGYTLHMVEPSGQCYEYYGCAMGKGRQTAKNEIEKLDLKNMTCREAAFHLARMLHKSHEDMKEKKFELELSWVCQESDNKHKMLPLDLIESVSKEAMDALEKEAMGEEEEGQ